ncbi:VWA domain-containing protein [Sporosarcina sp. PTS2304]|uniref:VWA domain-containing protein n=1 Tax=Sporosarcina sp. PTS2304 TaxID=2283194 RepID=UPI000E0D4F0B|nr:VWA domain-containing protein [Sporosarcina sp. PTS2304]AXH98341.1 VWA domain-containing protein [Sporosarcina sp. PTS2304]
MKIRKMTHWILVLALCLALLPIQANAKTSFTDVNDRHYAKDAIEWAKKQGLTVGYPDGTFKPNQEITESQFVTMLVRFDCNSPNSFAARPGEHKAMGNYRYLSQLFLPLHGINSRYARDSSIERAHAARILAAYQGVDLSKHEAVYYLYKNEIAHGLTGKNDYYDYEPTNSLTRAETVNFLYQMSRKKGCDAIGLSAKATGQDNGIHSFPSNFVNEGEVDFERPLQPAPPSKDDIPTVNQIAVDIEKPVLTANGKDSTYITFTFRDCDGELIPYERELEFTVTSAQGAKIEVHSTPLSEEMPDTINPDTPPIDQLPPVEVPEVPELPENDKVDEVDEPETEIKGIAKVAATFASVASSAPKVVSDGPDVTIKVIAPRKTNTATDTITVTPITTSGKCVLPSGVATLTYEPKAEVQLELSDSIDGRSTLTATVAKAGGETITNFNGSLTLESQSGLAFNESAPKFINGVAKTFFITPTYLIKDEIKATAVVNSSINDESVRSIANKSFFIPVAFAPPITATTCTAEKPEIGFVIDSSGSMKRNDPKRLRVSKTQEFIHALQADDNIATHFTNIGMFIERGKPTAVSPAITRVKESGGTNIASGLKIAFSKFTTEREKMLILLTDGKSSKAPIMKELEEAKKRGIKIFTIGLGNNLDKSLLKQIASETGGSYFHIKEDIELPLVYQSILQEINCGNPLPTCSLIASVFESASVKLTSHDVLMETELVDACGTISKVIVRFSSSHGDLDYELTHRGQNLYMLNKKLFEIQDFQIKDHATFLAFDRNDKLLGKQRVHIEH